MKAILRWCLFAFAVAALIVTSGCVTTGVFGPVGNYIVHLKAPLLIFDAFKIALMCPEDKILAKGNQYCQMEKRYW